MKADTPRHHFGDFLRQRIVARGPIAVVGREAGLSHTSLYRYFEAADPEPLRIEQFNKVSIAKAAGYPTWEELDAAWKSTPVAPSERRKPTWGAAAAAQSKWERDGGKFDLSNFTAKQCRGLIEAAERRLAELEGSG